MQDISARNERLILRGLIENAQERFEYIDGRSYSVASPDSDHIDITNIIHYDLQRYFLGIETKCTVWHAPAGVYLLGDTVYVEPDIIVFSDRSKRKSDGLYGVPDLIVEVVSPSTKERDYGKKLRLYRKVGVMEYWIIDYEVNQVHIYTFSGNSYHIGNFEDTLQSGIFPGLEINFASIKDEIMQYYQAL